MKFLNDKRFIEMAFISTVAWLLIINWREIGLVIFSTGILLNWLVRRLNNDKMPVDMSLLNEVMFPISPEQILSSDNHKPMTENTKLNFLADRICLPFKLGCGIMSLGDILIMVGPLMIVHKYSLICNQLI